MRRIYSAWIGDALYEVMTERIEVVRGIMGVLSGHLRARVHDVAEFAERLQQLPQQP